MKLNQIFLILLVVEVALFLFGIFQNVWIYGLFLTPTLILAVYYHLMSIRHYIYSLEERIIKYLAKYKEADGRTICNFLDAQRVWFYVATDNLVKAGVIHRDIRKVIYDGTEWTIHHYNITSSLQRHDVTV